MGRKQHCIDFGFLHDQLRWWTGLSWYEYECKYFCLRIMEGGKNGLLFFLEIINIFEKISARNGGRCKQKKELNLHGFPRMKINTKDRKGELFREEKHFISIKVRNGWLSFMLHQRLAVATVSYFLCKHLTTDPCRIRLFPIKSVLCHFYISSPPSSPLSPAFPCCSIAPRQLPTPQAATVLATGNLFRWGYPIP